MAKVKTTMSVSEMQRMLGLSKTEAYWLVHKNVFDTIIVEKKMRVVIASFEKWYANQLRRSKVNGPPPGAELRACSLSVKEMSALLGISDDTAYTIIKRDQIETFEVDYWTRIRKDVFEKWYRGQTKYRTIEDQKRDKVLEEAGYTIPEIARMLLVPRNTIYALLDNPKNEGVFETFIVAEKKRVTKQSFEAWYQSQHRYRKLEDRSQEEQDNLHRMKKQEERPRLMVDPDKQSYDIREAAILLDLTEAEVRRMIQTGELEAKKYGRRYLVLKSELKWWILQQKLDTEM